MKHLVAALFIALSLVACVRDPFVGTATAAPVCAVDCHDGTCCKYHFECHNFQDSRTCEPTEDWATGASRDAGELRSYPRTAR